MRKEILESRNRQSYRDLLTDLQDLLFKSSAEFRFLYYTLSETERRERIAFLAKLRERINVISDSLQLCIIFDYE